MKTYDKYVNFLSSLMVIIPPKPIYHKDGATYDGKQKRTKYFPLNPMDKSTADLEKNIIYIDLNKIEKEIDVYLELAYEVRHCAQFQATQGVGLENIAEPETVALWKEEFNEFSLQKSFDQSIELDAIAFVSFVGEKIFKVGPIRYKQCNKQMLNKYLDYIKNTYSDEDIKDSILYSHFHYGNALKEIEEN